MKKGRYIVYRRGCTFQSNPMLLTAQRAIAVGMAGAATANDTTSRGRYTHLTLLPSSAAAPSLDGRYSTRPRPRGKAVQRRAVRWREGLDGEERKCEVTGVFRRNECTKPNAHYKPGGMASAKANQEEPVEGNGEMLPRRTPPFAVSALSPAVSWSP